MAKPKRIVVDASIARSAGTSSTPGSSSAACREILEAIQTHHRFAQSHVGSQEWRRHSGTFARGWLKNMVARRRVDYTTGVEDRRLRHALENQSGFTDAQRSAMLKDAHLLEAALETECIVLSRDEAARALFHALALTHAEVRRVLWSNPVLQDDEAVGWIQSGAKAQGRRALGASTTASRARRRR